MTRRATFAARIAGDGDADWLRTGDLGFVDAAGEVFVTGRIKDVIIVRGADHYPQDIEHTAQATAACLRAGFGAAFPFSIRADKNASSSCKKWSGATATSSMSTKSPAAFAKRWRKSTGSPSATSS